MEQEDCLASKRRKDSYKQKPWRISVFDRLTMYRYQGRAHANGEFSERRRYFWEENELKQFLGSEDD